MSARRVVRTTTVSAPAVRARAPAQPRQRGLAQTVGRAMGGAMGMVYGHPGAGRAAGGMVAKQLNRAIDSRLKKAFPRVRGRGDYVMDEAGGMVAQDLVSLPRFSRSDADVTISKCEFVGDIVSGSGSPTAFTEVQYYGNPGLSNATQQGAFNWLSNIANAWESYEFIQCIFHYQPTSGNSTGANTALGQVVMAASYSPSTWQANNGFGNKQSMLDQQFAVTGPPSKMLIMPIECKRSEQNFKFHSTRSGPLASGQNIDIFDMFGLSVATTGVPTANQPLGELYVTYTIKLSKTQTNGIGTQLAAHYISNNSAPANDCTPTNPLGTGSFPLQPHSGNGIPLTFNYSTGDIQLPASARSGTFNIQLTWYGTAAAPGSNPPTITYTNATATSCVGNALIAPAQVANVEVLTSLDSLPYIQFNGYFTVTAPGAIINLAPGSAIMPATTTWLDIILIPVPGQAFSTGN